MTVENERLLKVLRLTGSDQDGEALAALRMAQRIMAKAGLTWEGMLSTAALRMSERDRHASRAASQSAWGQAFAEEIRRKARERASADEVQAEAARRANEAQASRSDGDPRSNFDLRFKGVEILIKSPELLTEWERGFLGDWEVRSSHRMTAKQREIFIRIIDGIEAKRYARAKGYG